VSLVTIRWLLHPVTAAIALVVAALVVAALVVAALTAGASLEHLGATVLLLVVAGAAAGFANSGST
jgi:hypothetical protein